MSTFADIDTDQLANVGDGELQNFLMAEQQKAQFQAQVHRLNEICWEKCVEKPSQKLDSRTETCLANCVERFIDTSMTITQRFSQLLHKSAANANANLNQLS